MKDQERVPLRLVLRNFLNHIENLESQSCPEKSYEAEFQDLKIFSENVKSIKEYSSMEGEKEVNRKKNRYKDILPFDLSRVVLNEYAGIPGSDYINANFIKGASGSPAYIASQGPLPSTVNDFWRMVVQCEVQVIVMACNEEEANKAKCEKYWVDNGEEKIFGMISVKLLKSSTVCPDFSVRTMRLKYSNSQSVVEERTVCQLHYVAWPDHGVPTVVQPLLDMVRLVRDTQASETLPVLVHCSAGCGRTGTICAIDYVWGLLRTGKLTSDFSLLSLIRDMRKQRIAMVQTKEQYVLVHQAVRELFKEQLCMIDSHPYENVDPNGLLVIKDEENTYDCIDYVSNNFSEEKHDNKKEKEVKPPPLPSKKNLTLFSSKYEKEVENLTAQQRSHYLNNNRNFTNTTANKVDKRKIDNNKMHENVLYEKVVGKKTQETRKKSETAKPIPSKGILRVPQLETITPKCSSGVKRSKSLKVVGNCDKHNLSFCLINTPENKRRSSLESNFDEQSLELENNLHLTMKQDLAQDNIEKPTPQNISKYDLFRMQDHKPLVRSYTSIDMRQKMHASNISSVYPVNSPAEDHVMKQRCKLLRSNTQINVVKRGNITFSRIKNSTRSDKDDAIPHIKVVDDCTQLMNSTLNFSLSQDSIKDYNTKLMKQQIDHPRSLRNHERLSKTNTKYINTVPKISDDKTQPNPPIRLPKSENRWHFKDSKIIPSNSNSMAENSSNSYLHSIDNYVSDLGVKRSSKSENVPAYSLKIKQLPPNPVGGSFPETIHPSYQDTKYSWTHTKPLKTHKRLHPNKLELPIKNELSLTFHGSPKDSYNNSQVYREPPPRLSQVSISLEECMGASSHSSEEHSTYGEHCSVPTYSDRFQVEEPNDIESNCWIEKDNTRNHSNYSTKPHYVDGKIDYYARPRAKTTINSLSDDANDGLKRLENKIDRHKFKNPSTMVDHYEETKSDRDLSMYERSYNKECMPVASNDIKYVLQNRKNIHQYNTSHSSRNINLVPNPCIDLANRLVSRTLDKSAITFQRIPEGLAFSQDNPFLPQDVPLSYDENDCFHSAPGVDLDQVAASITKQDGNLMKVALEAFQTRKSKIQITPKDVGSLKGLMTAGSGVDKKKQQQYL